MQQTAGSCYQTIHGKHTILAGLAKGLYVCVCLECGKLLGVVPSLRLLTLIDRLHICCTPGWAETNTPRPGSA